MPINITFRELVSPDDHAACVELQRETWGRNFTEVTPPTLMTVARKIGGVIAGAFDEQGRLLGFIFSIVGLMDGRVVHWSQKLAVRKELRDQGLGIQLKLYQREFVLKLGIEHSTSTVRRYMSRRRSPSNGQSWRQFITNHRREVFACDFLVQYTARFEVV